MDCASFSFGHSRLPALTQMLFLYAFRSLQPLSILNKYSATHKNPFYGIVPILSNQIDGGN